MKNYFDYNATTPVHPEILKKIPEWIHIFGNPSSIHREGRKAHEAIEKARQDLLHAFGLKDYDLVFTSGGTESNHLATSFLFDHKLKKKILISSIDHSCIVNQIPSLRHAGYEVLEIPATIDGIIDLHFIEKFADENTAFLSLLLAGNETGVIQPVNEVKNITNKYGIHFHCDAGQVPGKMKLDFSFSPDSITFSSHKIYGLKGSGALAFKKRPHPFFYGGDQERGLRPGTENTLSILSFAMAAQIIMSHEDKIIAKQLKNRNIIEDALSAFDFVKIHGKNSNRISQTTSVALHGLPNELLVIHLDRMGYYVSRGSACHSSSELVSHVLTAMGVHTAEAKSTIRISSGLFTEESDAEEFADVLKSTLPGFAKVFL